MVRAQIAKGIPDPGAWRFAAIIALLVSVGFVLLGAAAMRSADNVRNQADLLVEQGDRIVASEARIAQLAAELTSRGIDIPPPPTTIPVRTRRATTTTAGRRATVPPSPSTTVAPSPTTSTTRPLACVSGICIGGNP